MQNCLIALNELDEPAITGTDVTVASILEELGIGDSIDKICTDRHLDREDVLAALSYAEMSLPHSKHSETTAFIPAEAAPLAGAGDLDYSLLIENAGYFDLLALVGPK
jgi:uncharacterized protein (DUF433 family)